LSLILSGGTFGPSLIVSRLPLGSLTVSSRLGASIAVTVTFSVMMPPRRYEMALANASYRTLQQLLSAARKK
jgi:hypothetical protein